MTIDLLSSVSNSFNNTLYFVSFFCFLMQKILYFEWPFSSCILMLHTQFLARYILNYLIFSVVLTFEKVLLISREKVSCILLAYKLIRVNKCEKMYGTIGCCSLGVSLYIHNLIDVGRICGTIIELN